MLDTPERQRSFRQHNGAKATPPFSAEEYQRRLTALRSIMAANHVPAVLLTSMHNIAYYTGFLYCSFGRPFGCVVTPDACTTISANIDGGQPWRRTVGDNVIYTDWRRDNFWFAAKQLLPKGKRIGVEGDHLTLHHRDSLFDFLGRPELVDLAPAIMGSRMIKSAEEIALIKEGARIADLGGEAIRLSLIHI